MKTQRNLCCLVSLKTIPISSKKWALWSIHPCGWSVWHCFTDILSPLVSIDDRLPYSIFTNILRHMGGLWYLWHLYWCPIKFILHGASEQALLAGPAKNPPSPMSSGFYPMPPRIYALRLQVNNTWHSRGQDDQRAGEMAWETLLWYVLIQPTHIARYSIYRDWSMSKLFTSPN